MKIAFFTEMGFVGKISRTHKNMRTEFAWMCALEADHYNLAQTPQQNYNLGIIITPKNKPQSVDIDRLKQFCDKIGIMQEGPSWYFQDYPLENQIHYYNNLLSSDILFVHNEQDKKYYKGLTNHPDIRVLQSLMITDQIKQFEGERSGVMIGGNMVSWYGGFDSFMLASSITDEIYSPKMGRAVPGEEQLGIKQLPYLEWTDWMFELSKRKIGIHMMRTHAAGTFALNCSYLGIPCLGYYGLDTQEKLHPNLTIELGDLESAKKLVILLNTDKDFYQECSSFTKEFYNLYYKENIFLDQWKK